MNTHYIPLDSPFMLLFGWLQYVIVWSQSHGITLLDYHISYFHLALGGFIIYTVLKHLPIWKDMEEWDDMPQPYHSEYEDDFNDW